MFFNTRLARERKYIRLNRTKFVKYSLLLG